MGGHSAAAIAVRGEVACPTGTSRRVYGGRRGQTWSSEQSRPVKQPCRSSCLQTVGVAPNDSVIRGVLRGVLGEFVTQHVVAAVVGIAGRGSAVLSHAALGSLRAGSHSWEKPGHS